MHNSLRSWLHTHAVALLGAVLIMLAGIAAVKYVEYNLRNQLRDYLRLTAERTEQTLSIWLEHHQGIASLRAESPTVKQQTALLSRLSQPAALQQSPAQTILKDHLQPSLRALKYEDYEIISPAGVILASSRPQQIGQMEHGIPASLIKKVQQSGTAAVSPPFKSDIPLPDNNGKLVAQRQTMFSLAPIMLQDKLIGLLAFRINPIRDFAPIFFTGRTGATVETYGFDRNLILLTESRFTPQLVKLGLLAADQSSALNIRLRDPGPDFAHTGIYPGNAPPTLMAAAARDHGAGSNLDGYRDYRGIPVVGYWLWNKDMDMGIASEIDLAEGYKTLELTHYIGLSVSLGLAIFFFLTLYNRTRYAGQLKTAVEERTAELEQQRARYKMAEEHMHLLLDNAGEGIYGMDTKGYCTFANRAALSMTGYNHSEFVGKAMHELIHHSHADGSEYPQAQCNMSKAISTGQPQRVIHEVLWRKDGSAFPVRYISTPIIQNGRTIGAVVIFSDITSELRAEKLKDEFVSVVSHELRTPLTAILASLGMINAGVLDAAPDKRSEALSIAERNAQRLLRLINDLLDINKLEAGKVVLNCMPVQLCSLLEDCVAENAGFAQHHNTRFEITPCPLHLKLRMDYERMKQVITNLLSNAAKFSPPDQPVEISVSDTADSIAIHVTDHGPGIPPEFQDKLFTRFSQADTATTRQSGGTGLGLAIARELVELHGGQLSFTTEQGKGTTFTVTLPRD